MALSNLAYVATWYLNEGFVQPRVARSGHPSLTPSQLYRTRDGWIFIMCNKEKFWPALAEALGKPEWAGQPDFATPEARLANRDRLTELLEEVLTTRTTAEWLERLGGKVPVAPVNDVPAALENPLVQSGGRLKDYAHPTRGSLRMVAGPVHCEGDDPPTRAAPALGADTDDLLGELGYDSERIARLRKVGAV